MRKKSMRKKKVEISSDYKVDTTTKVTDGKKVYIAEVTDKKTGKTIRAIDDTSLESAKEKAMKK